MFCRWLAFAFAALGGQACAVKYHVVELTGLNSRESYAWSVNSSGVTVGGVGGTGTRDARPFWWTPNGGQTYLWFRTWSRSFGAGRDVNEAGMVAGEFATWVPRFAQYAARACVWTSAKLFAPLPESGDVGSSYATAINNKGHVAGYQTEAFTGRYKAFLWRGGNDYVLVDPLWPPYFTYATDVNDRGEVVGYAGVNDNNGGHEEGWYWSEKTGVVGVGLRAGFPQNQLVAINNQGIAVGLDSPIFDDEIFTWTPGGGRRVIGKYPGSSIMTVGDINDGGQIVGGRTGESSGVYVYDPQSGFADLWSLLDDESKQAGWFLAEATGISNNGWICGYGVLDGRIKGFVAYPVPD